MSFGSLQSNTRRRVLSVSSEGERTSYDGTIAFDWSEEGLVVTLRHAGGTPSQRLFRTI
jgi:hypothetical protein